MSFNPAANVQFFCPNPYMTFFVSDQFTSLPLLEDHHFYGTQNDHFPSVPLLPTYSTECDEIPSGPPSPPANYLENSHFYVSEDGIEALKSVATILSSFKVDFKVFADKYKLTCKAYVNHQRTEFVVRVFSPPTNVCLEENQKNVIEFQKRCGDRIAFNQIYRGAKAQMLSQKQLSSCVRDNAGVSLSTVHTNTLVKMERLIDFSSLAPLESMCECEFVDVKSIGFVTLASLSEHQEFYPYLSMIYQKGLLLKGLNSTDEDCYRAAASVLANLTTVNEGLCNDLITIDQFKFHLFSQDIESQNFEVSRQMSKILLNIVSNPQCKKIMQENRDLVDLVYQYLLSSDKTTAEYGEHIIELLDCQTR